MSCGYLCSYVCSSDMPAGASLAAFGVADQALLFRYLTLAQDVFPVLVRVLAFLEHEAHRRADQLEALAEEVLEIAAIGLGEGLQAGAVDDERRRVLGRSEEHTSELQSLMSISYAVFCL